jgi:hypothetical protein
VDRPTDVLEEHTASISETFVSSCNSNPEDQHQHGSYYKTPFCIGNILCRHSQSLGQKFSNCGGRPPGGRHWSFRGASCLREGHIYLDEIWRLDKIYTLVGTSLGWNILLTSQYRYWLRTVSSTLCCRLKSDCFLCRNRPTNKTSDTVIAAHGLVVLSCRRKDLLHFGLHILLQDQYPVPFPSCVVRSARQRF